MTRTLPQIIMLNHAAWFNHEQGMKRHEAKQRKTTRDNDRPIQANEIEVDGKMMDEMTAEEIARHVTNWG